MRGRWSLEGKSAVEESAKLMESAEEGVVDWVCVTAALKGRPALVVVSGHDSEKIQADARA
jgi:hypothetical protein